MFRNRIKNYLIDIFSFITSSLIARQLSPTMELTILRKLKL